MTKKHGLVSTLGSKRRVKVASPARAGANFLGRWFSKLVLAFTLSAIVATAWQIEANLSASESAASASTSSPDTSSQGQAARELCEQYLARNTGPVSPNGPRNPHNASLVASYPSKASHVASAEERRNGHGYSSSFRDRPGNEFAALCFFDFDAKPSPETEQMPRDMHQRLEVVVRTDGTPYILRGGRSEDMEPGPLREDG